MGIWDWIFGADDACADLETKDLQDMLEYIEDITDAAIDGIDLSAGGRSPGVRRIGGTGVRKISSANNQLSGMKAQLMRVKKPVSELKGKLGTASDICSEIHAIRKIGEALKSLDDPSAIERDPDAHAAAFGKLFEGLGHFAEKLPTPLNIYAPIFSNAGNFFVNMRHAMDPQERGRGMNDALREIKKTRTLTPSSQPQRRSRGGVRRIN